MLSNVSSFEDQIQDSVKQLTFGWIDYSLFTAVLLLSGIVGVYFAFFSKKQETTTEYLLGGKTMGYFPVAMSLTASHLSGNTLLGVPSEVYQFGTQYAVCALTLTMVGLMTAFVFLPVFYKLQLTSTFEYLEMRFGRSVRQFSSILFTISLILQLPIIVYAPALALSQVTGFSLYHITPVICAICIFYTAVGGLKAAVWTDTIQFTITLSALFVVLGMGIISVGGFGEIWRISEEGGRLILFNMDPNPFVRTSFWGMSIGLTTTLTSQLSVHQGCMQKFLAVPTISDSRKFVMNSVNFYETVKIFSTKNPTHHLHKIYRSIFITTIGMILVKLISVYTGLIMYAKYHNCDPISTKSVKKPDQLIPYYMMDVARNIPGLPGLFIAGLMNAGLSALSSGLNTAAGTIWEDFISPWVPESETKQKTATRIMKITVVVLGVLCVTLVFVVEHLGEIFALSTTMMGVTGGTVIALYSLGVLAPWVNYKGVVIGGVTGFVASAWIVIGAQIHKVKGNLRYDELPVSTDNCSYVTNVTNWNIPTRQPSNSENEPMIIFTVSFLYYSLIGAIIVTISATVVSFLTGGTNLDELNRDHFSPIVQRFIPRKKYTEIPITIIDTTDVCRPKNKEKESQVIET